MAKHAITSFSYPLKEIDIVEEAEKLAKTDGKSLSQLILRLLKEEISQKKVKGSPNPLNISYGIAEEKPLQLNLEHWIDHVAQVQEHRELNRMKGIAQEIVRRTDKRSIELRKMGIKL